MLAAAAPGRTAPGRSGRLRWRGRAAAGLTVAAVAVLATGAAPALAVPGDAVRTSEMAQLTEINVPAAWRISKGAGVTVAVLDTGVDASVPDLAGSVRVGPDLTLGADPPGYHPPHLHATFIASIIAGHGHGPGHSDGIIGVAPKAKILSVRVILDDTEPGFAVFNGNANYLDTVARGIRYAVAHGATVINMSLGGTFPTRGMRQALGYAISHGVVVVASAGNNGSARKLVSPYEYPASFPGVIAVAATRSPGKRASFSARNSSVVISAPGVGIIGAGPGGQYLVGSGTSPAAAFVSGVAALIRSRYPGLSPALVEQAIIASATHRPSGGYSTAVGFGEVNATAALAAAGRLASQHAAPGLASASHFGKGPLPGPIQVVHRDTAAVAVLAAIAILALALAIVALIRLTVLLRRAAAGRGAASATPRT